MAHEDWDLAQSQNYFIFNNLKYLKTNNKKYIIIIIISYIH